MENKETLARGPCRHSTGLVVLARQGFTALSLILASAAAAHLLWSAWCAFTRGKYTLADYGFYTNMIWNSGHGALFRMLVDDSYLRTHLSFTLALLGPLFRLWDHPLLLMVVQWLLMVGGAVILWRTSRLQGQATDVAAALVFFFVAYVFTQQVMLSEFHGISTYYLLVPWLYHDLTFRPRRAWLPLALICGVREDAFFFILPLLLYVCRRDRSRTAGTLTAAAMLYGLFALFVLFPLINGISVFERRPESLGAESLLGTWDEAGLARRLRAALLTVLPLAPFLGRRLAPALFFPSFALATALFSGFWRQQALLNHYPAPVMTMLTIGLLEAAAMNAREPSMRRNIRNILLVALVIGANAKVGFLTFRSGADRTYTHAHLDGPAILRAAAAARKTGTLVTNNRYAAYFANRQELLSWNHFDGRRHRIDAVFDRIGSLPLLEDGRLLKGLQEGHYGVRYFDGYHVLIERGAPTEENEFVVLFSQSTVPTIRFTRTAGDTSEERWVAGGRGTRYWDGTGGRGPALISRGGTLSLPAGEWRLLVRYRGEPGVEAQRALGRVSLLRTENSVVLVESDLDKVSGPARSFHVQELRFRLERPASVELQVTGYDARLWLDQALFVTEVLSK